MVGIDPGRRDAVAPVAPAARGDLWATLLGVAQRSAGQMGAENFPVALRVLPRQPRHRLAAVYRYARFVDDVGDEAEGDRLAMLDLIDADVRAIATGAAQLPPVRALVPVVRACDIPLDPLLDLVAANRDDQVVRERETFADLLAYCELSAAPVGRLVLHIAAAATPVNVLDSDQVCAALQVLEHCQDVGEDARAGRVYLPQRDLRAAGVEPADLLAATTAPAVRRVVARQCERADELLQAGPRLVARLSGWARVAVAGYVAGGLATVAALTSDEHDVLARDIRPAKRTTAAYALRLLVGRGRA